MSLKDSPLLLKSCRDRERPGCCRAAVADDSLLQITFYFSFHSFFLRKKTEKIKVSYLLGRIPLKLTSRSSKKYTWSFWRGVTIDIHLFEYLYIIYLSITIGYYKNNPYPPTPAHPQVTRKVTSLYVHLLVSWPLIYKLAI